MRNPLVSFRKENESNGAQNLDEGERYKVRMCCTCERPKTEYKGTNNWKFSENKDGIATNIQEEIAAKLTEQK